MPAVCTMRYCKAGQSTQGFADAVAKQCHVKAKKTQTAIHKGIHLSGPQRRKKSCSRSCICVTSPLFSLKTKRQGLNGTELRPPLAGGLGLIIFFGIRVQLLCQHMSKWTKPKGGTPPCFWATSPVDFWGVFTPRNWISWISWRCERKALSVEEVVLVPFKPWSSLFAVRAQPSRQL